MTPTLQRSKTMSTGSISSEKKEKPISRKRSREENDVAIADAKCEQTRKVIFDKQVKSTEFHTQLYDTESPVFMRLPSTQSTSSQASTLLDEDTQPVDNQVVENKAKKKKTTNIKQTAESIAVVASSIKTLKKKIRTYPKPVPTTKVKRTQWIDPLETDKKKLDKILYKIFIEQRPNNNFKIPDAITNKNVCTVIYFVSDQIMVFLKDPVKRGEFLNPDNKNLEFFLKNCVNNYTQEEGLDKETFRLIHSKREQHRIVDQSSYTYEMIQEAEREQILKSIPIFLSNTTVKEHLETLCQQFAAESV